MIIWLILFICLSNLSLGLLVLLKQGRGKNIFFILLSFISSIWCFNNFMTGITTSEFWLRGAYAWGSLVMASGLIWVLKITKEEDFHLKSLLIGGTASFFFVASYYGRLIIYDVDRVFVGRFEGTAGPLFIIYSIVTVFFVSLMLYKLAVAYKRNSGIIKHLLLS